MGLFDLFGNVVKVAVNVVSVPATIVNAAVVKPLADATEAVKDTIDDLID